MYVLLILTFLLLIIYFYNTKEHFNDNTIYSDKNIFINNKQQIDIDTINVNRLCIKDEKGLECINKSQLFNLNAKYHIGTQKLMVWAENIYHSFAPSFLENQIIMI